MTFGARQGGESRFAAAPAASERKQPMGDALDYIVVGYAGLDRILRVAALPRPGITALVVNGDNHILSFGGNASNIACALGRLGCSAAPLVRVGEDWEANGYKDLFQRSGVDSSGVHVVPGQTTSVCHLVQDANGDHVTMTYPGAMDMKYARPYPDELFRRAACGVLTVGTKADTQNFLAQAEQHALPYVFGMRADFESFPKDMLWHILLGAQVSFMNRVECAIIEELYGLADITALLRLGRAHTLVVTLGGGGSDLYVRDGNWVVKQHVPVTPERRFVDATGAGDSYMAGYLYGMSIGAGPVACAQFGSTMASFVVEEQGCLTGLPTPDEMHARNDRRMV